MSHVFETPALFNSVRFYVKYGQISINNNLMCCQPLNNPVPFSTNTDIFLGAHLWSLSLWFISCKCAVFIKFRLFFNQNNSLQTRDSQTNLSVPTRLIHPQFLISLKKKENIKIFLTKARCSIMSPLILKFTKEMFIYMSILCAKTKLPLPLSSWTPPRGSLCTRRCTPHTLGIPGLDNFSYLTKCLILIYMKINQCWSIITTWCDWPLKLNSLNFFYLNVTDLHHWSFPCGQVVVRVHCSCVSTPAFFLLFFCFLREKCRLTQMTPQLVPFPLKFFQTASFQRPV